MRLISLLAPAVVLFGACHAEVGPFPPDPPTPLECEPVVFPPHEDPFVPNPPIPGVCEDCQSACANLRKLGCATGDAQCLPACENAENQGTLRHVDFACLTWAKSCEAADKC